MYWPVFACLCALAIVSLCDASLKLPPFVKTCKRSNPNLSKCWRSSVENLRAHLIQGIPELYLPPLANWSMEAKVEFGGDTFKGVVRNVTYVGAQNFEILDNSIDLKENLITAKFRFPKLYCDMMAEIDGSILNYQFDAKGITFTVADDMVIDYELKGRRVLKDGEEFLSFYNINVDLQFKSYVVTGVTYLKPKERNDRFTEEFAKVPESFKHIFKKIYLETIGVEILKKFKHVYWNYPLNVLHPVE